MNKFSKAQAGKSQEKSEVQAWAEALSPPVYNFCPFLLLKALIVIDDWFGYGQHLAGDKRRVQELEAHDAMQALRKMHIAPLGQVDSSLTFEQLHRMTWDQLARMKEDNRWGVHGWQESWTRSGENTLIQYIRAFSSQQQFLEAVETRLGRDQKDPERIYMKVARRKVSSLMGTSGLENAQAVPN